MGSAFEFIICHHSESQAQYFYELAVKEVQRIENILSEFKEDSITSQINQSKADKPIQLDTEVYELIHRCKIISELSSGYFDITAAAFKKIYKFNGVEAELPETELIQATLKQVGHLNLELHEGLKLIKKHPDTYINFAAIGKGYAAEKVRELWLTEGLENAVINASGDLCVLGTPPDQDFWDIGIPEPSNPHKLALKIPIHEGAVASSGNTYQFFTGTDKKYSHNLNPLTGYPASHIDGVSVFHPSAEFADAMATALHSMDIHEGIELVNQLGQTHCIITDARGRIHFSKDIEYHEN